MVFIHSMEMFSYLNKYMDNLVQNKDRQDIHVDISTYGLSLCGRKVGDENYSYNEEYAREFMEKLGGTNSRILVGLPPVKKYQKSGYGMTQTDLEAKKKEIRNIGEEYDVNCFPVNGLHLKMYRIDDLYITGGINFGTSFWNDSAVVITETSDKERLQFAFDAVYRGVISGIRG